MRFNIGGFGGGWGGGNRFTAASNPCPGPFYFPGSSAKAPPFSAFSGMSLPSNVLPGTGIPGTREIFDHPIVQATNIKASVPLGYDLPTMNLSARSSAFDSASFCPSVEFCGGVSLKISVDSDFNPFPSSRPESNVVAPPRESHSPALTAAPAEQKAPPPVPDQRATGCGSTGMSSLVGGLRNLGEHIGEVEPMAECPGGETAYRAACRETDREVGEALSEAGKKCAAFADEHPVLTTIGGMVATEALSLGKVVGAAAVVCDTVSGAVKAFSEALKSSGPGGLTFATAGGPTLSGALETTTAAVGVADSIGVGTVTTATAASDVPLSMSLKEEKIKGQRDVGNAGSYEELNKGTGTGGFQDEKEIHHVVPRRYLEKHNIPEREGLSVVLPEGLHKQTSTYASKAKRFDLEQSFRDATAKGLKDTVRVEKGNGAYGKGRKKLIEGLKKHKKKFPKLYRKEGK